MRDSLQQRLPSHTPGSHAWCRHLLHDVHVLVYDLRSASSPGQLHAWEAQLQAAGQQQGRMG